MRGQIFISHATDDNTFVKQLARQLEMRKVWVDFLNLDAGAMLPQEIAEAIDISKWFVVVATKKSMASRWVRYELNIALVKWIEEADCRILVVRIDNCDIPPELSPFLRVDCPGRKAKAIKDTTRIISDEIGQAVTEPRERRGRIVNRFEEISVIEDILHEDIEFIFICGLYGIGKTTLIQRSTQEVFKMPLARFPLREAHGPLRLSLELNARAKLALPLATASEDELRDLSVKAIMHLMEQGYMICFDDVENVLTEEGTIKPFLASLLPLILRNAPEKPIFLCTNRRPNLEGMPAQVKEASHIIYVGALKEKHMLHCLENWLRFTSPGSELPPRDKLRQAVSHLFGYPLAARLAAHYIVKFSVNSLVEETRHFKEMRVDIAKHLLARVRLQLDEAQLGVLAVLSIADIGASQEELTVALEYDPDKTKKAVEKLGSILIVFPEHGRIQIHPIVRDYFWKRAYESGKWRELAQRMAEDARRRLSEANL